MNMVPPRKANDLSETIRKFREAIINSSESESDTFYRCEFCGIGFSHVSDFIEHFSIFAGGCLGKVCAYFSSRQIIDDERPLAFRCVFEDCGLCIKKSKGYQKEFHRHLKSHGDDLINMYTKTRLKDHMQEC